MKHKQIILVAVLSILTLAVASGFRYRGVNIETTSFSTRDIANISTLLSSRVNKIDCEKFASCSREESTSVDSFIDTVQRQAINEKWESVTFKISMAGKKKSAGVSVQYKAKTQSGAKIEGGGTVATDLPAVVAFINE
jgi:hypothetical protein